MGPGIDGAQGFFLSRSGHPRLREVVRDRLERQGHTFMCGDPTVLPVLGQPLHGARVEGLHESREPLSACGQATQEQGQVRFLVPRVLDTMVLVVRIEVGAILGHRSTRPLGPMVVFVDEVAHDLNCRPLARSGPGSGSDVGKVNDDLRDQRNGRSKPLRQLLA